MPILTAEPQIFPADLLSDHDPHVIHGLDSARHVQAPAPAEVCEQTSLGQLVERRWWVVQTKPRQEKSLARDLLVRRIPFYLPQVPQTALVRGRCRISHLPVFPGYLFLFGDESERGTSLTTNRIANLLPVIDDRGLTRDLQQIWQLIETKAPLTVESRLKAGDRVRVKKGALAGVEGTVVDRRGRCRVLVAVHLLQQGVSMEIDDYMLEPI